MKFEFQDQTQKKKNVDWNERNNIKLGINYWVYT